MATEQRGGYPVWLFLVIAVAIIIALVAFFLPFWTSEEGPFAEPEVAPIERPIGAEPAAEPIEPRREPVEPSAAGESEPRGVTGSGAARGNASPAGYRV